MDIFKRGGQIEYIQNGRQTIAAENEEVAILSMTSVARLFNAGILVVVVSTRLAVAPEVLRPRHIKGWRTN